MALKHTVLLFSAFYYTHSFGQLMGGDFSSSSTTGNNNFSPLFRPYDYSSGSATAFQPYLSMNSLGGYGSQYGSQQPSQYGISGLYGHYGQSGGQYGQSGVQYGQSGGQYGQSGGQYGQSIGQSGQYSSGGGCCMPASTANALASSGIGSVYYGASQDSTPTVAPQTIPQPSFGQAQIVQPYASYQQIPYTIPQSSFYGISSQTGSNNNYGSNPSAHYCVPVCGGQTSNSYGGGVYAPVYGSYNSNGLLNAYGSNSQQHGNGYGSSLGYSGYSPYGSMSGGRLGSQFGNGGLWPYGSNDANSANDFSNSLFGSNTIGFPRRSSSFSTTGTSNTAKKR